MIIIKPLKFPYIYYLFGFKKFIDDYFITVKVQKMLKEES